MGWARFGDGEIRRAVSVLESGGYFNNGKVQTFRKRPLEQPEVRPAGQTGWDLVLSLPTATPATFLGPIQVP